MEQWFNSLKHFLDIFSIYFEPETFTGRNLWQTFSFVYISNIEEIRFSCKGKHTVNVEY